MSQEMTRFDTQPSSRRVAAASTATAAPSTSRSKVVGIVICKHCHAKNDRSPSDFEMSQDVSQSDEEKVTLNLLLFSFSKVLKKNEGRNIQPIVKSEFLFLFIIKSS